MSRFKIVVFLVVTSLAGAIVAGAWWLYTRVIGHDDVVQTQIKVIQGTKKAPIDPGIKRFDKAVEIVRDNTDAGRDALYELLRYFPDSSRAAEAKRIIGEMNLDALFSQNQSTRKEYTVQPGDSLGRIAGKNQTTVECLMRANGMMGIGLQPGDHLIVFPLDFEIQVNVAAKTLTLLRNGRFFKEYPALEVRLPPGFHAVSANAPPPAPASAVAIPARNTKAGKKKHVGPPPSPPGELSINDKAAWVQGKRVASTDPRFITADKWLMGSRAGFNIRALPAAKAVGEAGVITTSTGAKSAPKNSKSTKSGKRTASAAAQADEDHDDATAGVPETGVFLAREDIEELFTIIRTGTKVKALK